MADFKWPIAVITGAGAESGVDASHQARTVPKLPSGADGGLR